MWLTSQSKEKVGDRMPLSLRPDKSKVVISGDSETVSAHCDRGQSTAWQSDPIGAILNALAMEGRKVVVNNGAGKYFLIENGKAREVMMSQPDVNGVQCFQGYKA